METYISILRGINVGGKNKIKMNDLKELYEELKFKNIITYIQSGNIIFNSNQKAADQNIAKQIEKGISKKFNLDVAAVIRTINELKNIIKINPFLTMPGIDIEKLHVTFLEKVPGQIELDNTKKHDYTPDKFIIAGREVFLYCPGGYGKSKLSNNFFENKLKVKATTRNWKTVKKLVELAEGIAK